MRGSLIATQDGKTIATNDHPCAGSKWEISAIAADPQWHDEQIVNSSPGMPTRGPARPHGYRVGLNGPAARAPYLAERRQKQEVGEGDRHKDDDVAAASQRPGPRRPPTRAPMNVAIPTATTYVTRVYALRSPPSRRNKTTRLIPHDHRHGPLRQGRLGPAIDGSRPLLIVLVAGQRHAPNLRQVDATKALTRARGHVPRTRAYPAALPVTSRQHVLQAWSGGIAVHLVDGKRYRSTRRTTTPRATWPSARM